MKRTSVVVAASAVLAIALVGSAALAQGRGMGRGRGGGGGAGMCNGQGPGAGMCNGQGPGAGMRNGQGPGAGMRNGQGQGAGMRNGQGRGAGAGGWWTRVTPKTAAQKSLVDQVSRLHSEIRSTNQEIAALRAQNASQDRIEQKLNEAAGLRAEMGKLARDNAATLKDLGVPANCGVCDGTGPKADCPLAGSGQGRGNGRGLRDGTGPNPNCPLKK